MKHFFFIIGFLLLTACQSVVKFPEPDVLLTEDQMVNALVDMALLKSTKSINKEELQNSGISPETFLFTKHQMDSTVFKENIKFYTNDLEQYEAIFQRVIDSLRKKSEIIKKAIEPRKSKEYHYYNPEEHKDD